MLSPKHGVWERAGTLSWLHDYTSYCLVLVDSFILIWGLSCKWNCLQAWLHHWRRSYYKVCLQRCFRYTIYSSMHLFQKIKEKIEKNIFIILTPWDGNNTWVTFFFCFLYFYTAWYVFSPAENWLHNSTHLPHVFLSVFYIVSFSLFILTNSYCV